jgi:hypothetical protein
MREPLATMRTTDGRLRLLAWNDYWAAVAINRQATRASTVESGSIRDRARLTRKPYGG